MNKNILNILFEKISNENWENRTLKEISVQIFAGTGEITSDNKNTGNYPAIKSGDISYLDKNYFHECSTFVDEKLIKNYHKKTFKSGDILIISQSGSINVIGKSFLYLGEEECIAGSGIYVIKHNQNPNYLIHALSTNDLLIQLKNIAKNKHTKGMPARISINELKEIKIPIPPRNIQDKIANYLDKFYELEAELRGLMERELEDRKKQYEYYKNQIFHRGIEEFGWEIKLIEEIATEIYSGNGVTKNQLGSGDYPVIRYSEIHKSKIAITKSKSFIDPNLIKKKKYCETGDILFAKVSENLEESGKSVVYDGKEKCLVGDGLSVVKHNQNPKYLSYALSSEFCRKQIVESVLGIIVFNFGLEKIKQIKVPMPEPEDQDKVSEILDKFHTLTEDIISGIPGLIKDNRERYEYYRDRIFEM